MTDTVVAEGQVKFRDGKKWKTRWVVLRKPSPVADCLSLLVYKEKKKGKASGHKERLNVTLEGICGVEPGPGYDGVSYTLTILCLARTLVLGFNSRDALLAWDAHVRYSLGEVHRFSVNVEPGTKLESGPASLHLCNNLLVLTRGLPPVVIGHWKLSALRRYGAVPNGFVFEGGTRCGYWAGVFFLSCSEGEQISFLFDCIVSGVTPSRAPHGLRPSLPADLSANPASAEERINQEASELEKRLSMLSQCSLASSSSSSSTASTYSCSTSVAGDDHSSISSSSSSQSDTSYGSRLPFWVEPLARLHLSSETVSSSSTLKVLASSDDRLYTAVTGGPGTRPSSAQLHPRGLHDSGRQSSLDSGIGIATGSQSSYSGSCSSCTGSLDAASQGGGDEIDSVASQPAPSSPLTAPPPSPPPPSSPFQSTLTSDRSAANSPCSACSFSSRSSSRASGRHSEDYQIPSMLRPRYDTPRSLLHTLHLRESPAQGAPPEPGRDSRSSGDRGGIQGISGSTLGPSSRPQRQAELQHSHSWGSERAPSVDSEGRSTPRPLLPLGGLLCEETQCSADNYITPEQWRSVRNRCLTQAANPPPLFVSPADTQDARLYVREENDDSADVALKKSSASRSPSVPPPLPITLRPTSAGDARLYVREENDDSADVALKKSSASRSPSVPPPLPITLRPTSAGGMFRSPCGAPPSVTPDAGLHIDRTIHYVNILPFKPNRELLHSEMDLQDSSSAPVSSLHRDVTEEGSLRYAHLDRAAMGTAQRVGAEHDQGREDRLTQQENRRRGHHTECND